MIWCPITMLLGGKSGETRMCVWGVCVCVCVCVCVGCKSEVSVCVFECMCICSVVYM